MKKTQSTLKDEWKNFINGSSKQIKALLGLLAFLGLAMLTKAIFLLVSALS